MYQKFYGKVPRGKEKTKFVFRYDRLKDVEVRIRENHTYPKISLSRGVVLSQSTFHLVVHWVTK